MMEILPEVADRVAERTNAYLRALEAERMRLVSACMLAEMGFSL